MRPGTPGGFRRYRTVHVVQFRLLQTLARPMMQGSAAQSAARLGLCPCRLPKLGAAPV